MNIINILVKFIQRQQASVNGSLITFLDIDSVQVPHGFVCYEDPENKSIEVLNFAIGKPELLFEISPDLMESFAQSMKDMGLRLRSVSSYMYPTVKDYEPAF